jgi:ferric-dicitrate binding protein FerR (iron transport regulator)
MEKTDEILNIVTGNLKGHSRKQLFSSLDNEPGKKEEFNKIKNAWALFSATKPMPEYQVENLYLNFKKQLVKRKAPAINMFSILRYAAILVIAVAVSSLFFYSHSYQKDKNYTSVIADNGQISKIILPDSSVVWLNSGTKITYNNGYAIGNRKINLNGQAFFKVTKNKELPLQVFCKGLEVKVMGTKFDVSAYPEDKNISVVLESGKVELLNPEIKSFNYQMSPGERVVYNTSSKNLVNKKVKPEYFTSWKEGILIFRDDRMDQVIIKLKRRFNIDIEVADREIYKSLFTATIKDETLEEIFKSISFACSVRYKIIRDENLNARTKVILERM